MVLDFFLLIVGLLSLVKGSDFLVEGASSIAKKFNISNLTIGLTVVSFGTSVPELLVNSIASVRGHSDVVFSNVIGSNNFNTLFILGIIGVLSPLPIQRNTVRFEMPILIFITLLLLLLVNDTFLFQTPLNVLSQVDSLILLICFFLFMYYVYYTQNDTIDTLSSVKIHSLPIAIGMLVIGLAMLAIGGELTVTYAVHIAQQYGISERIIGLTILAMGTSLPELITSLVAIYKKNVSIAIGNVIGSNVFNICLALGVAGLIQPLEYHSATSFDIFVAIASSILLFFFMFTLKKNKIDRREAFVLLVGYVLYITYLIYMEGM